MLGDTVVVCQRPSLGDNYLGSSGRKGVLQLPRISCKTVCYDNPELEYDTPELDFPIPQAEAGCSSPPLEVGESGSESQMLTSPDSDPLDSDRRPPEWATQALAQALRERLGMELFNFDLICPDEQPTVGQDLYYVVDINYFPGVDKIPNFEEAFVHFLLGVCMVNAETRQ